MGRPDRTSQPRHDRPGSGEPAGNGGPEEAARYLVAAVADLGRIARRHHLETLGFLLDMAQMEAEDIVRQHAARGRLF